MWLISFNEIDRENREDVEYQCIQITKRPMKISCFLWSNDMSNLSSISKDCIILFLDYSQCINQNQRRFKENLQVNSCYRILVEFLIRAILSSNSIYITSETTSDFF
jgi:hypothetical protein